MNPEQEVTKSPVERKSELEGIFANNALQATHYDNIGLMWLEYMVLCSDLKVKADNERKARERS
jgi:hypothetical protein